MTLPLEGIRIQEWKYIHAPKPELYRIAQDTGETEDLSSRERERLHVMEKAYWEFRERMKGGGDTVLAGKKALTEEMERKLQGLGYVWSREERPGERGKDPKDMIKTYRAITTAQKKLWGGEEGEGAGQSTNSRGPGEDTLGPPGPAGRFHHNS